jgi:hypothetical protein
MTNAALLIGAAMNPIDRLIASLMISRAKREIRADVEKGVVPADVASFADLHDHADANCYGGADEPTSPIYYVSGEGGDDPARAEWAARIHNFVMERLDTWIKAGGLRAPAPVERADCEHDDREVVASVHVSCKFCGFDIGENRGEAVRDGMLTCESCGGTFAVPPSAIHEAQWACLVALGEADADEGQ